MSSTRFFLLSLVFALPFPPPASYQVKPAAQPAKQSQASGGGSASRQAGAGSASDQKSDYPLTVDLSPSRISLASTSDSFAIIGVFTNHGNQPVTLVDQETILVVTPEASANRDCATSITAWFSTESASNEKTRTVTIPPHESYPAEWTVDEGTTTCQVTSPTWLGRLLYWKSMRSWLDFQPGKYRFEVAAKPTWPGGDNSPAYHTFEAHIDLTIGISQLVTAVAAGFGGLLALFLAWSMPQYKQAAWYQTGNLWADSARNGRAIVGAFLLSATFSVISSRLSQTSLPIKISVDDVWGALTLGFLAYFAGNKIMDWLFSLGSAKIDEKGSPLTLKQYEGKVGDTVQIFGKGFAVPASVTFNGVAATNVAVASETELTAVVPAGATTGSVVVTTPTGSFRSNKVFKVNS